MVRPSLSALALLACASLAAPAPAPLRPALVLLPGETRPILLGAWDGGRWLSPAATVPRLGADDRYRVQDLRGQATTVRGTRAASLGVPCEDSFDLGLNPATASPAFRVVTTAATNTRPRPVTVLPTSNQAYRGLVRDELVRRGLKNPQVDLLGLTRADLDGDGTDEVIVEAAYYTGRSGLYPPPVGEPGDYSLLLLRSVRNGKVKTTVLGASLAPRLPYDPGSGAPMPMASFYRLAGLADLNGDGRMEVLTFSSYYEGFSVTVGEWTPQGGLRLRLETGCGA
ncbi:hypothetical protein [Deinococcus apachensis]|uniref:hypothetical protein n=1 Tax=Deinococcus apachensis TaxID=309886 RepID=UPI00036FF3AF|nr:hypothetical protein [Deinococcus apachensis]